MEVSSSLALRLELREVSQVAEARRAAVALAAGGGFPAARRDDLALAVTEAATNVVRHGGGGELLVQMPQVGDLHGAVELWALDRGRGMADVGRCLGDGYSTAGTLGGGLGAIRRLSQALDIYSRPDEGTVLWARLGPPPPTLFGLTVGALTVPKRGELECGDAWAIAEGEEAAVVLVADGLGHGPEAAVAARAAIAALGASARQGPEAVLDEAAVRLRSLRGAAGAAAQLSAQGSTLRYAGLGNITGFIIERDEATRRKPLISHNGTLGLGVRKVQGFAYPWTPASALVMASDGLASGMDLSRRPGLWEHHPAVVAGVLYRDHSRDRDDATVLVATAAAP